MKYSSNLLSSLGMKRPRLIYVLISTLIFTLTIVWGYLIGRNEGEIETIRNSFSAFNLLEGLPPFALFILILLNNAVKTFFVVVLGFLFGIAPIYFLYINGIVIGIVISYLQQKVGLAPVVVGLLPHGIFEVPALLLASAIGLWLGWNFILRIIHKEPFWPKYKAGLLLYAQFVLPLLLIAAFIEAYITPYLINLSLLK